MEIQYRITRLSQEQKIKLATDYNAGMPIPDIMEKYKIGRATIYRILNTVVKGGEQKDGEEKGTEGK